MPGTLAFSVTPADTSTLALAGVFVILIAVIAVRAWKGSRVTPEERERRRRAALVASGKMGDASLVDIRDDQLFYSYAVRGVEYTASQDVSTLRQYLPPDFSVAAGHVFVKYDPRNPANSVVLSEQWNGLRTSFSSK